MSTRTAMEIWCRHFTGVDMNGVCEAGESYRERRILPSGGGMAQWPCTDPRQRHTCAKFEPHTQEEIEERVRRTKEWLESATAFETRKTEDCPQCGQHVEHLEQVERCVYAHPCGCRVWQGSVPSAWKESAK